MQIPFDTNWVKVWIGCWANETCYAVPHPEWLIHRRGESDRIGVQEVFYFDPTEDYLDPPMVGYRRGPDGLEQLKRDASGALTSEQLGVLLRVEGQQLVMYDAESQQVLLTRADAEESRADAAQSRADAMAKSLEVLEAEVERLRAQRR